MVSLVSSSVNAADIVTTYNVKTAHEKNETAAQAINIGNLDGESATIAISDQGSVAGAAVSTTFTALAGTTSLAQSFNNPVDQVTTQFQLYDNQGNIIADSQGTPAQQASFQQWLNGSLVIGAGTYTAIATPFASPYGSPSLTINKSEQQGTSLQVNSQLTGSDPSEYYNFSLSGNNIKLDFNATTNANDARVVLYDSNHHVVADSGGNGFQRANYQALTSATGLSATSGNYTVKVTYNDNVDPTAQNVDYNFQLYSGNSYAIIYKNKVAAQPTDTTAAGSVTPTKDAQLYERKAFNKINAKPSSAVNIGWIKQDKSALDVHSQLTNADNVDYYSFTLQQGNNLKFGFKPKTTPNPSRLHVQLLDGSGSKVIADNLGTKAQRDAYKALTTTNGLSAKVGGYVVKVAYAPDAPKTNAPYEFGLYSGTGYSTLYTTTASAQTYGNALLSGTALGSASSSSGIASYLTALKNGDDTSQNLTNALKTSI
jgi:hypothetical protein